MIIEISEKTNVSADRLWEVFGEAYPEIGTWSSGVFASKPRDGSGPGGAAFQGRICETNFGKLTETVTTYDPAARKITYLVKGEKMPGFVKRMENNWQFRDAGNGKGEIAMRLNGDLAFPMNVLMGWMMKIQLKKDLRSNIEELIHFAEKGQAHPRKVKVDGSAKAQKAKAAFA
ncbi:MAG: SRPBCC family protein [Pseudomonadota bacterium]